LPVHLHLRLAISWLKAIDFMFVLCSIGAMSVIFNINRDFPYQVPLAFDEATMDVLNWLEGSTFEWDMYVDLPHKTLRYCFRTLADASTFQRRFGHALERRAAAGE
jgi:hypothetical protein